MSIYKSNSLLSDRTKIENSIEILQTYGVNGAHLAFSGGKDSVVIERLARMSGIKFDTIYSNTTVDPPEIISFIKNNYEGVTFRNPNKGMFELIPELGPPLRKARWCCARFKELSYNDNLPVITGVRSEESTKRAKRHAEISVFGKNRKEVDEIIYNLDNDEKRRFAETCMRTNTVLINPILNWTTYDVWCFIRNEKLPYCSLYDQGFDRLGCIGCTQMGYKKIKRDFIRWPKHRMAYYKAISRYLNRVREEKNKFIDITDEEYFAVWTGEERHVARSISILL